MKVLFVDDEPRILAALERGLTVAGVEWDAHFAHGGEAALSAIANESFDVVVSDVRMPRVDGAGVLRAVRDRSPATVRIVLTGQADEAAALSIARLAHQCLAKPCDFKVLRQVVERTGALNQRLADPKLRQIVASLESLPTALNIFHQLSEVLARDDASVDRVAELVRQDPAMASKLLQFVNSAFFAQAREIADIRSAVVRLGMKTVKNLVLGVGVFDALSQRNLPSFFSLNELQGRGLSTARIASRLTRSSAVADTAYMAGLVCDIGELVLAATLPSELCRAWHGGVADARERRAHEQDVLGATHAEIGACLLGLWGLPFAVVEAVAHHHRPGPGYADVSTLVWIASAVAASEVLDEEAVIALGASELLERARELAARDK